MAEPTNDSTDSATEPPKNKRTAERQITKDDDNNDEDDCHPMDKTEVEPTGTFQKADPATLAARKILKAKRPPGNEEAAAEKTSNPFAMAFSKTGGSVFGSAFGSASGGTTVAGGFGSGFGSGTTGGFEFASKGATATSFGSVFGSTTTSSFGSTPTGSSIFGHAEGGGLAGGGFGSSAFATATVAAPAVDSILPEVDVKTGEEEEALLHEVRAKTFELVEEEDVVATITTDGPIPASSSIPPSIQTTPTHEKKEEPETKDEEKNSDQDGNGESGKEPSKEDNSEPVDIKTGEASDDTKPAVDAEDKKKTKWREVGIGPLRVLKKDRTRVVQRRETAPGSLGTKLMVNVQLRQECTITRPSEKHLQLGAIIEGKPASFLFKLKNSLEAQALQDLLKSEIQIAESYVTGEN
jgi:hypothetical protein